MIGARSIPVAISALLLAATVLPLAGCDSQILDPTRNARTWQPEGINQQNIAAMVANPQDLASGHGQSGADTLPATAAIRIWESGGQNGGENGGDNVAAAAGGSGGAGGGGQTGAGASAAAPSASGGITGDTGSQ